MHLLSFLQHVLMAYSLTLQVNRQFITGSAVWGVRSVRTRYFQLYRNACSSFLQSTIDPDALDRDVVTVQFLNDIKSIHTHSFSSSMLDKKQQCWLDLRETVFFPHEAIMFLEDQLNYERISGLIDKILVSRDIFDRIIASENRTLREKDFDLLYEADDTKMLVANSWETDQSIPFGAILECQADDKAIDPIRVLDLLDDKKWVVLDAPKQKSMGKGYIESMLGQISSLLHFWTVSEYPRLSQQTISSSGLVIPGKSQENNSRVENSMSSGLAVFCPDRDAYLRIDALFAEFRGQTLFQESMDSDSGILVPRTATFDSLSLPATALIIPLDLQTWKFVLDLREGDRDEKENRSNP